MFLSLNFVEGGRRCGVVSPEHSDGMGLDRMTHYWPFPHFELMIAKRLFEGQNQVAPRAALGDKWGGSAGGMCRMICDRKLRVS